MRKYTQRSSGVRTRLAEYVMLTAQCTKISRPRTISLGCAKCLRSAQKMNGVSIEYGVCNAQRKYNFEYVMLDTQQQVRNAQ